MVHPRLSSCSVLKLSTRWNKQSHPKKQLWCLSHQSKIKIEREKKNGSKNSGGLVYTLRRRAPTLVPLVVLPLLPLDPLIPLPPLLLIMPLRMLSEPW